MTARNGDRDRAPVRLLIVVPAAGQVGGLETIVRDAAETLDGKDFRVTLGIVGDVDSSVLDAFSAVRRVVNVSRPSQLLKRVGPVDVLHLHSPTLLDWSPSLVLEARRRRVPVMVTIHLPAEPSGRHVVSRALIWSRRVGRAVAGRLGKATIYAPSQAAASDAQRRLFDMVRVRPLLQGVPDPGSRGPRAEDGILRLVFVGRMVDQKRPILMVEAVAAARDLGAAVTADFVGDGPLLPAMRARAQALALGEDVIRFHGYLADPLQVMADADLLLLPSVAEGSPVVVMEAAALGRASLVRAGIEGVDEILGDAHFTFGARADAAELGVRLRELAADLHLVRDAGTRAREQYDALFSLEAARGRYVEAYRSLEGDSP